MLITGWVLWFCSPSVSSSVAGGLALTARGPDMNRFLGAMMFVAGLLLFYLAFSGRVASFIAALTAPGLVKEVGS